ncbi:expressed unknown protein [Seminavis robusta]|uniref:Uncharacterized protein n=1 Tax=Seminavis robusta TaxID=568900 RepID=A0A9N8EUF9_9STRA|nr:expressed unknown protein [Seminavis robusta]|eukprot:Sro1717_g293251.1  (107) ;mRNA; f:11227-11547
MPAYEATTAMTKEAVQETAEDQQCAEEQEFHQCSISGNGQFLPLRSRAGGRAVSCCGPRGPIMSKIKRIGEEAPCTAGSAVTMAKNCHGCQEQLESSQVPPLLLPF